MPVLNPENYPEDEPTIFAHTRSFHNEEENRLDIAQNLSLPNQFELARMMLEVDKAFSCDFLPRNATHIRFSIPDLNARSERIKELITLLFQKTVSQHNLLLTMQKQSLGLETPPFNKPPQ